MGARVAVRPASFWIVAATLGLFLFAAAAPSPLYAVYAARWHFSAIALTEAFGVYALALLLALLLTGSLSDAVGRRPMILAAVVIELASMFLFVVASDVNWLFAARITQGIGTGVATSALAAALVDLQPSGQPGLAPLVNSATPILALAAGALASAALVQYAPDPLHLVYWLIVVGLVVLGLATAVTPEPITSRRPAGLVPRIGVESAVRPHFTAALPSLVAGWAVGGFYLSLGPSLALLLAGSTNRLLGGFAITVVGGVGAAAVIAVRNWPPYRTMEVGGIALVAGLALAVVAIGLKSSVLFYVATAVTGVGFGAGWLGVLRKLVGLASPTARAALLTAIFIVSYVSFAVPAVAAGYLVTRIGLHDAALWYAAAMGAVALVGLLATVFIGRREAVKAIGAVRA